MEDKRHEEYDENRPARKAWAKILPFLGVYKLDIISIIVIMLFNAALDVLLPVMTGYVVKKLCPAKTN